eukprot:c23979_g1_i1 orf=501-1937(-)
MVDLSDNPEFPVSWCGGKSNPNMGIRIRGNSRTHWRSMSWCGYGSSRLWFPTDKHTPTNNDSLGRRQESSQEDLPPLVDSQGRNAKLLCSAMQSVSVSKQRASSPSCPSKERNGLPAVIRNGVDIKLDLEAVENVCQDSDEAEGGGRELRERMIQCDKECSCILPFLFLGSKTVAQSLSTLRDCRITHILNCVGFVCPEYFPNDFFYKTLWLQDSPNEDIVCLLYDVFDYIEDVREQDGGRLFVHCCQGVSRSATLVIAYLMWRNRLCFEDAFEEVKGRRSIANPNMGFIFQLLQWQTKILSPPDKQLLIMYRISPHSAYDPLHLVPKYISVPQIQALDSRGAFVIQLPNILYVWRGKGCDKEMSAAAGRAAFQLMRFENARGPVVFVSEGNEPEQLQEALRKPQPKAQENMIEYSTTVEHDRTMGGLQEKHVPSFDTDYEMFAKAKLGGYGSAMAGSGAINHLPARVQKRTAENLTQ